MTSSTEPDVYAGCFECCPPPKANAPKSTVGKLMAHVLHEDWFTWDKITKVRQPAGEKKDIRDHHHLAV